MMIINLILFNNKLIKKKIWFLKNKNSIKKLVINLILQYVIKIYLKFKIMIKNQVNK